MTLQMIPMIISTELEELAEVLKAVAKLCCF
jgi:hypothetical protein